MNNAAIIKERVSTREAAARYGLHVDRQGWACCPFHHEAKPSLKVYEGKNGWHCFGCNAGGSVIDLVMKLEGVSFSQAVVRLDHDFNLGLGGRQTAQERSEAQRLVIKIRRQQQEALKREYDAKTAHWESRYEWWFTLSRLAWQLRPKTPEDITDLYADVMWYLPIALEDEIRAYDEMLEARKRLKEYAGVYI